MKKKERNKLLQRAYDLLDQAHDLLLEAEDAERESYEAWPENLQGTEAYEIAEGRATMTEEAKWAVEEIRNNVQIIIDDDVL